MGVRRLIYAALAAPLLASGASAAPQSVASAAEDRAASLRSAPAPPRVDRSGAAQEISEIVFVGLRRVAPAALQAQISSRAGEALDPQRVAADLRALARLGWFSDLRAEMQPADSAIGGADRPDEIGAVAPEDIREPPTVPMKSARSHVSRNVRLIFIAEEQPFLTRVVFSGSRLLSREQIDKILAEKKLSPHLGAPADPAALQRIGTVIQAALAELGHPLARVRIRSEESPNFTTRVRFEISDGPHIPVGRVSFEGHPAFSAKLLRRRMQRIRPDALFAGLRQKDAYTSEAFAEDRERLLAYYQNHGFPEARIGDARVSPYEGRRQRWFPWPHGASKPRLALAIPVEAGRSYHFGAIEPGESLADAAARLGKPPAALPEANAGRPYSAQALERLRRAWLARVQPKIPRDESAAYRAVEFAQTLDPQARTVRVKFNLKETPPYLVRQIEFRGPHRFSDRYLRRRILLEEGRPFDDRALEAGIARLARTGYFRTIRKEDIHVQTDELSHSADVTIHVEEIGQQRASLTGGHGAFGNTLGIVYTVFDLLNREELLTAQLEGGPESLQVLLSLTKDGFLGSRGALAFSVFRNVIRPHLAGGVKGPFFTSQSEGLNAGWSYALTNSDSFAVNYGLSRDTTRYSLALPAGLTGLPPSQVRSVVSSRTVGLGWARDTGSERILFTDSVSGGVLGGRENAVRSSAEFSRIFPDPFFHRQNAWAFRTTFSGAGSYHGDLPVYARFFSSDELVRGLRPGELGPYAAVSSQSASGAKIYSASPAGADLLTAANAEYRVPLGGGIQAAGFFDLGSGLLLPNWLGHARPVLLDTTNGLLHGSLGVELRWTVPGVQVPVRGYYALNVLRLNRSLLLPDGSLFRVRNRFSAFGWALGTLF